MCGLPGHCQKPMRESSERAVKAGTWLVMEIAVAEAFALPALLLRASSMTLNHDYLLIPDRAGIYAAL